MFCVQFWSNGRRGTSAADRSFYSKPESCSNLKHGGVSVYSSLGDEVLVDQYRCATKTSTSRYKLDPTLFRYLQTHFEEIFGASLSCDPFVSTENTSLSSCVSRLVQNKCYFILWDPQQLDEVFSLITRSSIMT